MNTLDRHEHWMALLPAYLLQRLNATENAGLTAHLQQCETCREELHLAARLQSYFKSESLADSVLQQWLEAQRAHASSAQDELAMDKQREQRNFDRLWSRIDSGASATGTRSPRRWLPLAAAALVLAGVGTLWREHLLAPVYRTLSSDHSHVECGALRVRFVDNLATSDLQNLLRSVDAQIVSGPTPRGVYTVRVQAPQLALQRLHLHPAVLLAEPTGC